MKKELILWVLCTVILVVIIPFAAVYFTGKLIPGVQEQYDRVKVYVKNEDKVVEMDTSHYLKEVVGAEMPATFSYQALKAQAVAARTYLFAKIKNGGNVPEHKGAVVCTDHTHCKAWMSEEERKAAWEADKRDEYWSKISGAVDETAGEIMCFNGEPINAVFHSTSSGKTENACDVWGGDVPYLVSVESKGDELSPKYTSQAQFTEEEFKNIVSQNIDNTDWNSGLYTNVQRSEAGGITKITLGGVEIKGTTFRSIFGLSSTNAQLKQEGESIIIDVKGNGHGVGMSQYGAEFMANNGTSYKDILEYYYTGAQLENPHL